MGRRIGRIGLLTMVIAGVIPSSTRAQAGSWQAGVDSALGRKGTVQPDSSYKFSLPRSDLSVTIGPVALKPALALGSWVAFLPTAPSQSIAMGDLVLTESEIGGVMRALQAGGVEQTALHNHLRGESPHVMYMHIMARGNPVTIARTIHTALAGTGTPMTAAPAVPLPAVIALDTAGIAKTLGHSGKLNGIVYQISVPRSEVINMGGVTIPPSMGLATAINIQPTGSGRAVATGDFVLLASEVNPVLRALQSNGIDVTAIHSHMLDESPHLFFMHFWGNNDALSIARGLRAALDATNSK
jgi:hypothetical protein